MRAFSGWPRRGPRMGTGAYLLPGFASRGGSTILNWANLAAGNAIHAWDFRANQARFNNAELGPLSATPNWTFTRASTAYYRNSAGVLIPFGSGVLRTGDRGALIEGAGTNLHLYSQAFDNAVWTKTNCTVTPDAIAAPDGTTTADLVTVDSTAATLLITATGSAVAVTGTNCTASVYVKRGNAVDATAQFVLRDNTAATNKITGTLTWSTMTISGTGASISQLGSTDWYRITLTDTAWTSTNTARLYCGAVDGSLTVGHTWYLWGAQLEATAYASSYVPTTTGSATRAADSLTVTGVSELDYPLTLYAEFERASDSGTDTGVFEVNNGTTTDRTLLNINSSDLMQVYARTSSVDQVNATIAGALAIGTVYKTAARISTNDSRHALGGTLGTQDTSCTNPATPSKIVFGNQNSGTVPIYGYLRRLAIFSRALSDGDLQALTT